VRGRKGGEGYYDRWRKKKEKAASLETGSAEKGREREQKGIFHGSCLRRGRGGSIFSCPGGLGISGGDIIQRKEEKGGGKRTFQFLHFIGKGKFLRLSGERRKKGSDCSPLRPINCLANREGKDQAERERIEAFISSWEGKKEEGGAFSTPGFKREW